MWGEMEVQQENNLEIFGLDIPVFALEEIPPQLEIQPAVNAAWVESDPIPQGDVHMLQDLIDAHATTDMLQEPAPGHQADMLQMA